MLQAARLSVSIPLTYTSIFMTNHSWNLIWCGIFFPYTNMDIMFLQYTEHSRLFLMFYQGFFFHN